MEVHQTELRQYTEDGVFVFCCPICDYMRSVGSGWTEVISLGDVSVNHSGVASRVPGLELRIDESRIDYHLE